MAELEERNFVEESNKAEIPTKSDQVDPTEEKMELEVAENINDRLNSQDNELHNIPLSFESATNYIEEWEKLFYLEIKAQIIRSAISESEPTETYFLKEGE